MKKITIKKYQLESIIDVLSYDMPFKDYRIKQRIIEDLLVEYKKYTKEKDDLITKLCEKDEKNNPKTTIETKDGKKLKSYTFTNENKKVFEDELSVLQNEDVIIDLTPSRQTYFARFREFIESSTAVVNFKQSFHVNEVIDSLEEKNSKVDKKD